MSFNGIFRVNLSGKYNVPYGNRCKYNFDFDNLISVSSVLKETQIKQWEKSLEEVKEHEFDEDCEYCVKNGKWHIEKTKSLTVEIKDANSKLEHLLTTKSHHSIS